jgi:hypothetical protein
MNKQDCRKAFEKIWDYAGTGKMLAYPCRGEDCKKVVYKFRSRKENLTHYEIKLKGNNITLNEIEDTDPYETKYIIKETLLKMPFKKYLDFVRKYELLTPDLRREVSDE